MKARAIILVVSAMAPLVGGCAQNQTSAINEPTPRQTQPTGLMALFAPKPAPELGLAQGQKLMAEISENPKRLEKLTPQEKRFLAKAHAAAAYAKAEKDAGRR
jgi:hypothetical protein